MSTSKSPSGGKNNIKLQEILYEYLPDITDVEHIRLMQALTNYIKEEIIGEDEKTIKTHPIMRGSIDPSPTGTLDELSYTEGQRYRNQLRAAQRERL